MLRERVNGRVDVMREGLVRDDDGNGGFGEVGVAVGKWVWACGGECWCEELGVCVIRGNFC